MEIGMIGCGTISAVYLKNARELFTNLNVVAVADIQSQAADARAAEYPGVASLSPYELLARDDIETVLNLTIPAAHAEVNKAILASGKHVYCEKPVALGLTEASETLELADRTGLRFGAAPDTFLGAGLQLCNRLIREGAIGRPIAANAVMTCHGHESWHPAPAFYYKRGGGPMLDMGPYYLTALVALMGPMDSVSATAARSFPFRVIGSEPLKGTEIDVEVTTHLTGSVTFTNGALATVTMSFDTWKSDQPRLEIHGTEGSLSCPDPNTFGGPVRIFRPGADDWETVPMDDSPYAGNSRGLGLSDMARAIDENTPHRASGSLATHVLEAMLAFDQSQNTGKRIQLTTTCTKPEEMTP